MARRSRNENLLTLAIEAHWGLSVLISLVIIVGFQFILPHFFSSPILRPLAATLAPIGWLLAGVFGLIALINFLRQMAAGNAPSGSVANPKQPDEIGNWRPPPWATTTSGNVSHLDTPEPKPSTWSLGLLQSIEWKRFEELTAAYFRAKNLRAETQTHGADGGVDLWLYPQNSEAPLALVQCKAWKNKRVGVKPVRELLGVMTHEQVARGFFMITGEFSDEAESFAASHNITLVSGEKFLEMVYRQTAEVQTELLAVATAGDFRTPTCAACGIKMKLHGKFWGCFNYPRCKMRIQVAT